MEVKKYNPFVVKPFPKTKHKPLPKAITKQSPRLNLKLEVGVPRAKPLCLWRIKRN